MRIRVITYNVHKCVGGVDRRCRPERVLQTIAHYDPDLALLQEVSEGGRGGAEERQVDWLGGLLGMGHRTYFPNVTKLRGGKYGNAILSQFPLTETRNIDVTIRPLKRRSVLHARYRLRIGQGGRPRALHVFNLHLGLSGTHRKQQLRRFLDSQPMAGLDEASPVIVAGDFNDVWGTLGRKLLEPAGFRGVCRPIQTFPAFAPVRALDAVYVRGRIELLRVFPSRLSVAKRASDHLPLIADLELSTD